MFKKQLTFVLGASLLLAPAFSMACDGMNGKKSCKTHKSKHASSSTSDTKKTDKEQK